MAKKNYFFGFWIGLRYYTDAGSSPTGTVAYQQALGLIWGDGTSFNAKVSNFTKDEPFPAGSTPKHGYFVVNATQAFVDADPASTLANCVCQANFDDIPRN